MLKVFSLPIRSTIGFVTVTILFLLPIDVLAQGSGRSSSGTGGIHVIQGYVFFPSGRRAEGTITVRLQSHDSGELTVTPDSGGNFVFSGLAPGNYTVVVDAGKEYEIARDGVFIDTDVNLSRSGGTRVPATSRRMTVMIHLQPKQGGARVKPGVLNAALAAVPENARKNYEKGLELAGAGNAAQAVEKLKEAIALYPEFPLALNELGVQYLRLDQPARAVEVLRTATKLSPDAFPPVLNLGIALLGVRQFTEAEKHLREAVKRNSASPTAHMYLGLSLLSTRNHGEAEKEFMLAVSTSNNQLGLPHYYLAGIYWKNQQYGKAIEALETYLRLTPNAADADRVRLTIKELKGKK
jgi:tetratricopeptide (TPR) repeat protein